MRFIYRSEENTLRLTLNQELRPARQRVSIRGYVDMGEGGRIVGLEAFGNTNLRLDHMLEEWLKDSVAGEYVSLDDENAYIELSTPEEVDLRENVRAVAATFLAELDDAGRLVAITIPRRGAGYEISYPSGNR